jgi:hypothetical protein
MSQEPVRTICYLEDSYRPAGGHFRSQGGCELFTIPIALPSSIAGSPNILFTGVNERHSSKTTSLASQLREHTRAFLVPQELLYIIRHFQVIM